MKLIRLTAFVLFITFISLSVFSGCSLLNKTPEKYSEGIRIDRDYPDDVLDIYDDAVVFESDSIFNEIILTCGTEDDIDDIIDFYRDFFDDNNIIPLAENEDKDEYFVHFMFDGYEFKVEIQESDGEYIEDLFENVIYVSAKEIDSSENNTAVTLEPTAISAETNQASTETTPEPTQDSSINGETPLTYIDNGSWIAVSSVLSDGRPEYADSTIYIKDAANGTFHYLNYYGEEKWDYDFTYTISNGILELNLENNVVLNYEAYFDDDELHLINTYNNAELHLVNWEKAGGVTPSATDFTAFGNWLYFDPADDFSGVIAFWNGNFGYIYNLYYDYANDAVTWSQSGDTVKFDNMTSSYSYRDLKIEHRGNVIITTNSDDQKFIFNRVTSNIMAGPYELLETTEPGIEKWTMELLADQSAKHSFDVDGSLTEVEESSWYIDPIDGMLYIYMFGDLYSFDYHYSQFGLILHDPIEDFTYEFIEVS